MSVLEAQREQTRARYPDEEGYVERDGVRVFYEVYGDGEPTVFLLPTWSIIHSRHWKMQIPYLARHFRVLTFDGRGNGKADRPSGDRRLHRVGVRRGLAGRDGRDRDGERPWSSASPAARCGARSSRANHPDRVLGAVFIGPSVPLAPGHPERNVHSFEDRLDTDDGWAKYNRHYWLEHYEEFLEYFFGKMFSEPHSTKQIEDCVAWGLEIAPETLIETPRGARALRHGALPRRLRPGSLPRARASTATRTRSTRSPGAPRSPRRPAAAWSRSRARVTARTSATR